MFIEAIILGIILGRLRSGKISGLEKITFRGFKIIIGAFLLDIVLRLYIINSASYLSIIMYKYYPFFSMGLYLLIIIALEFNRNIKFLRIIQGGYVLNFLPMITNGGKMPVLESALLKLKKLQEIELLRNNLMLGHKLVDESTRFVFLSDIYPINFFIPKIISIGDIVIAIGIILFISHYMAKERS